MDLDKEELEATKKHHKRKWNKWSPIYNDVKKLNKLYNTKYNFEIWEVKENENRKRDLL